MIPAASSAPNYLGGDHVGLGNGGDDGYGVDWAIRTQLRREEYYLKGGGPPADPSGLIGTKLRRHR